MEIIKNEEIKELEFDVLGAGKLRITESNDCQCGGKTGFGIGVEWGKYGFAGGMLPNEEALKLLDSTTFDDDAAPARGDAAAAEAARRPDVSDAVREQADEMSAETRTHRFIKLRKTA